MPRLNTNAEVLHDLRTVGFNTGSDTIIGETSTDGVTYEGQTEETPLKTGTSRGVYLYIPGGVEQTFSFSLVNFSLENVAEAFGLNPSTRITGTGTSIDPYILTMAPNNYSEQPNRLWFAQGLREDGLTVRMEFNSAQIFSPQVQIKVTTGEGALIPFRIRVTGNTIVKLWL